ncbi:hypothetical protein BDV97DRAFT_360683 [Delphinella strobiligena]|nr:hypothetical protein BDV97DRAFT_360683 [Delphinella strobiligena]
MSQSNTSSLPGLQISYRGNLLAIPLSNELLSFRDLCTFVGFFYFPNARQYRLVLYGRRNDSLVQLGEENWNRENVRRLVHEGGGYILAQFHSVQVHPPLRFQGQRIPGVSTNGNLQARLRQAQIMSRNAPANTQVYPRRSTMEMAHSRTSQSPLIPAQMMGSSQISNPTLIGVANGPNFVNPSSPSTRPPTSLLQRPESVGGCVPVSQVGSVPSDAVVKSPSSPGHSELLQQPTTGNVTPDSAPCPNPAAGKSPMVQSTSGAPPVLEPNLSHQQPDSKSDTAKESKIAPVVQTNSNSDVLESQSTSFQRGLSHQPKDKDKDVVEPSLDATSATSKENAPETASPDSSAQPKGRDDNTPAVPHERASVSAKVAATRRNIVDLTAPSQEESEDDEPPYKRRGTRTNISKTTSKAEQISITFLFDCRTKNFVPLEQGWKGFALRLPLDTDYKKIDDSIWSRLELQLADTPLSAQEQKDHVSFDTYIDGRSMQMGDKLRDFVSESTESADQSGAGKRKRSEADFGRNRAFGTVRLWLGPKDKPRKDFAG